MKWKAYLVDAVLGSGHARQQPLGGGHLFQIEVFGGGFGLPLGFEAVPELPVVGDVFAGDDEVAGAQAVSDSVEAGGLFTFGSFRTGGVLCYVRWVQPASEIPTARSDRSLR